MNSFPPRTFARGLRLVATTLVVLATVSARGVVYLDSSSDSDHLNAAAAFQGGAVWILGYLEGNPTPLYYSATYFDPRHLLLSKHQTASDSTGALVHYTVAGNGLNYMTNPGVIVNITNVVVYPGYNPDGSTPDLAIAFLDAPLPAPGGSAFIQNGTNISYQPVTIASVSQNEGLWGVGVGVWGTVGNLHYQDGNMRAWTAPAYLSAQGFSDEYFYTASFFIDGSLGPLNGRASGRDSGSPWYNSAGQLVGISIAGNSSYTIIEKLSHSGLQAWIQQTITPPEPRILSLTTEGSDLRLVWQGKGGSNYVVQAASALGGTNMFVDLSAPIALPGTGAVLTNYLDPGALTNLPARFYRVRAN